MTKKEKPKVWIEDYDEKNDIYSVHWNKEGTDYSEEMKTSEGHEFVIDYDKKGRICSIEIFDWSKGKK